MMDSTIPGIMLPSLPKMGQCYCYDMNEKCSPQACMFENFGSQIVELFGKVVEPLEGRNSLEEVGHRRELIVLYPGPISSLCSIY